jgi:hypothetical protein
MSNVLIGIIGVILFIGLALAGALFLGRQFQSVSTQKDASAAMATVNQVAQAIYLANSDRGGPVVPANGMNALIADGYLKAAPSNPVWSGNGPELMNDFSQQTGQAKLVIMKLGPQGREACAHIARQVRQPANDVAVGINYIPAQQHGCYRAAANGGTMITAGDYVLYARIGV